MAFAIHHDKYWYPEYERKWLPLDQDGRWYPTGDAVPSFMNSFGSSFGNSDRDERWYVSFKRQRCGPLQPSEKRFLFFLCGPDRFSITSMYDDVLNVYMHMYTCRRVPLQIDTPELSVISYRPITGTDEEMRCYPPLEIHDDEGDSPFEVKLMTERDEIRPVKGFGSTWEADYITHTDIFGTHSYDQKWDEMWKDQTDRRWPHSCSYNPCYNRASVGGLVYVKSVTRQDLVFVVPMCDTCASGSDHPDNNDDTYYTVRTVYAIGITKPKPKTTE